MDVIKAITASFHAIKSDHARSHFHGGSIHDTVAWDMTLTKNRALKHKHKYPELAIPETIQAGASWPVDRVADDLHKEHTCHLCEQGVTNDPFHTFWTCPKRCNSEEEAIIDSNYMKEEITTDIMIHFYNRALVVEDDLLPDEKI